MMSTQRSTHTRALLALLPLALIPLLTSCTEGSFLEPGAEDILFSLSPVGFSVEVGETATVTASIVNGGGKPVNPQSLKWESTTPAIATVDAIGQVTGIREGETLIIARSGQRADTTLVLVVAGSPVDPGVDVSPQSLELAWIGATGQFSAEVYEDQGILVANSPVEWTSLNPDIAEVNSLGEVIARGAGTAMIVASCAGCGPADTAYANVEQEVETVAIDPSSRSVPLGESVQLSAEAVDKGGTPIDDASFTWTSADESIATVSSTGTVSTRGNGKTTVSASVDSRSGRSEITVDGESSSSPPPSSDITAAVRQWNENFVKYGDMHWSQEVSEGGTRHNYYDRAAIWYRRGLPERGDYTAQTYIDGMVFESGTNDLDASMAPRNWAGEGVLMYWHRQGGQVQSKGQNPYWAAYSMAVEQMYDWTYSANGVKRVDGDHPDGLWEGRISERSLLAPLLAMKYGLPDPPQSRTPSSGAPAPRTWADAARHTLELILRAQEPEGNWPHPNNGVNPSYQINYMVAILLDALTIYYEEFEQDPRLPEVIQRSVDYLWTQWDPKAGGFPYYDNGDAGQPDLNLLFVSAWGFAYQHTGDEKYRQQGDHIFAEGVNRAWINQVGAIKQFNQQYRSAHRYLERTR